MYATGTQVPGPFKSITAGLCLSIAIAENKNVYMVVGMLSIYDWPTVRALGIGMYCRDVPDFLS